MIGEILGNRYKIQQQLGKKAGRRTFLARDLETEEFVVIKLLTFSSDFEWDDLKLFEREAQTLRNLSHHSIPRYLNYFDVDLPNCKGFALVQTYIDAKSLEEHLKAGRTFSEKEVKQFAKSLLEILIYLHGQNPPVIHRDIKPSNILLTARSGHSIGQVYLVDFGAVKTLSAREGATMTIVGTYGYMPPEQFGGRAVPASDLYSLGATLIYLVTGTYPADLPQKDLRIEFEKFTNLSPALTYWLRKLIEPSLDKRFQSAEEALQALEQPQLMQIYPAEISKPVGSQVLLSKTPDEFQLVFPSKGFHSALIFTSLFAIAWNSFILFWSTMAFSMPSSVKWVFILFSLPFWGAGISMVVKIISDLFGQVKLRIDRQQISLTKELFGFKFSHSRSSRREAINKLERSELIWKKDSDGDRFQIPANLIIWAGKQEYHLNFNLTDPELDWIASELSDWLGLPINKSP
jgi:serine/threonine protein kinase